MSIDLGTAAGFARAVMSDAATILGEFTGKDPKEWDILEGSYNGVLFHIFKSKSTYQGALSQITDVGGRRKVFYRFPYIDGQTSDDLGRAPGTFSFDILIFGTNYMSGLTALLKELNKPTPGDLVHPIRGKITVVPTDLELIHSSETRKAVAIKATFAEHNFTIGDIRAVADVSVKGALSTALDAIKLIDRAIVKVEGTLSFIAQVKTQVLNLLNNYKTGFANLLGQMNQTFNGGTSADIPGLLPVSTGGAVSATTPINFPIVGSPNDPLANIPSSLLTTTTSTALAVLQLEKQVNSLRATLDSIIQLLEGNDAGQGELDFIDNILDLKTTAISMQDVLEKGVASSQAQILEYVTPHVMSLREVAFANGISPDRQEELSTLNPALFSVNFIEQGTSVKVPSS